MCFSQIFIMSFYVFYKNIEKENTKLENKNVFQDNSIEEMRKLSEDVKLEEDILELIEKKPELIDTLSFERLIELNDLYDKKIEETEKEVAKLEQKMKELESA